MSEPVRTAIFGGTFNPIHNGHLAIASAVLKAGLADELWLMVTPQNPWKRDLRLTPDSYRLKLACKATEDMAGITASDFEFSLPKPSYTANTLRALTEAFPERQFRLVIGADNWAKFDMWYDNGYIIDNFPIIVYPRTGYPLPAADRGDVNILECPLLDISSTGIRNRLAAGESVEGMVPESITPLLGRYTRAEIR